MATKSTTFRIRMTEDERTFLEERARAAGLTSSEFARRVLGGVTLGDHRPGVVASAAPAVEQVAAARVPRGSAADGRRAVQPGQGPGASSRCPACSSLTHAVGAGKRRCYACDWTGAV